MSGPAAKTKEKAPRIVGTAGLARHLGLSRWTVSRVLNGHSGIREETRQRVLQAMDELSFAPNRLAQGLRGLPSGLIGVSLPYMEATILSEKGSILQEELNSGGYRGLFEITRGDPEVEVEVIRHFLSINVEGVVLIAPTLEAENPIFGEASERGVGVVALDPSQKLPVPTVQLNRGRAMTLVLQHLHQHGHRKIALMGMGSDDMYKASRMRGLRKTARDLDLQLGEDLIFIDEENYSWRDYASGVGLAKKLLKLKGPKPTALVFLNDRLAIAGMKTLRELGHRVPGDFSVVGFDNLPESLWASPSLTTIDQDKTTGMRLVKHLLEKSMEGKEPPIKIIQPILIERDSSGPVSIY